MPAGASAQPETSSAADASLTRHAHNIRTTADEPITLEFRATELRDCTTNLGALPTASAPSRRAEGAPGRMQSGASATRAGTGGGVLRAPPALLQLQFSGEPWIVMRCSRRRSPG